MGTAEVNEIVALTVSVARLGAADTHNSWGSRGFGQRKGSS